MENLTEAWALAAQWGRGGAALMALAVAVITIAVGFAVTLLCLTALDR